MGKLTFKELEALGTEDDGKRVRDDGGLFGTVRKGKAGVSVYFDWRYRFDGKVKQIAIGTWPKNSLAAIRAERDRLKVEVDGGTDPSMRRRAERLKEQADRAEAVAEQQTRLTDLAARQARITVFDLFERWALVDLVRRKDSGTEVRRMFEKDVLPKIGDLAAEDCSKGHVTGVTDALLARGVPRMAKLIFSLMRQMFRFAVDRDIIESDPTAAIRKARIGGPDVERERVLSQTEIKLLARQLPNAGVLHTTDAAIWIALSTCCRIGELLQARWDHIDMARGVWRIPAEHSKNGKTHTIVLSAFAHCHFERVRAISGSTPWCYPNRSATNHVSEKTVTKQIGDRQRPGLQPMRGRAKSAYADSLVLPEGKWTPHDLRRTGSTIMVELGVLPEVAERCLNHTEPNRGKRIYQRHSYEVEMRNAWRLLGERLELLTRQDDDNVVTLTRVA